MNADREYTEQVHAAMAALHSEIEKLTRANTITKSALANLMPFVLEDYYPNCATKDFKDAVEAAKEAIK